MAVSRPGSRPIEVESFQILGGDCVTGVATERPLKAAPRVGGLAESRKRDTEVGPRRRVPRIEAHGSSKLLLGGPRSIPTQQERAVVEPDARHAGAGFNRLLEHHLCAILVSGVRKPHRQAVEVVSRERLRTYVGVVGGVCTEPPPKLRQRKRGSVGEQFEHLVVVAGCANHDVMGEDDGFHRNVDTFGDRKGESGQRCAVAMMRDEGAGHGRGFGVSRFRDRLELTRCEQPVDHAARTVVTGLRAPGARRRLANQGLECTTRCRDLGGFQKPTIDRKKRIEQRRWRMVSGIRGASRPAAQHRYQSEPKSLLNESEAGRGSHANE